MNMETFLPLLMFAFLLFFILLGFPVAFTLAGTALLFAVLGHSVDLFYWTDLGFIPSRIFGVINNFTLLAVPLFIVMGIMLEKSGLAEDLLAAVEKALRGRRGSLAVAVVLVGALLAASTGIVGATVVTMGVLSLPTMIQRQYDKPFACGTIAAAGTLGQIIPPSIVLVLLGDIMNVDVGDLFIGALIPGVLLVSLYLVYILLRCHFSPVAPSYNQRSIENGSDPSLLVMILPPTLLMITVLGSILFGLASPTEAAACGAAGSFVISWHRGKLNWSVALQVATKSSRITAMVFTLLIGAQFFGVVFRGLGGDDVIIHLISSLDVQAGLIVFCIMAVIFVLGFFLDFLEICFIVIPIIFPVLKDLGYNPLWLAILVALNLQTSFLTPPFGFALFYLKGVAPSQITTVQIYRGIIPYVMIQVLTLSVIGLFPQIVTFLPALVFKP